MSVQPGSTAQPGATPNRGESAFDGEWPLATVDGTVLTRRQDAPVTPAVDAYPIVGTRWLLEKVVSGGAPDAAVASPVGQPASLELLRDGTFVGSSGCNGLGGTWVSERNVVRTADLAQRLKRCGPPVDEQERQVMAVLTGPFTAEVGASRLTLTLATGEALIYRADGALVSPTAAGG